MHMYVWNIDDDFHDDSDDDDVDEDDCNDDFDDGDDVGVKKSFQVILATSYIFACTHLQNIMMSGGNDASK